MKQIFHTFVLVLLSTTSGLVFAQAIAPKVEVIHYWRADSEQKALGIFREQLLETGVDWSETIIAGNREELQIELSKLMAIGAPPSVVHWVADGQLRSLVKSGIFAAIPDDKDKYTELYIPEVYQLISTEQGVISAPVGIHSYNFMVYNKALLDRFGLEPASDLRELTSYGPVLAKEGIYLTTVSDQGWQTRYPMISVLSSVMSSDEFEALFRESNNVDHLQPKLVEAMRLLGDIRKFADPEFSDLDWRDAVNRVNDGHSLVLFMGDFSVPEFADQSNLVCNRTPGGDAFYIGMDSFAFPVVDDPALKAGQQAFLDITTDPKFVAQYVNLKGGLPTIYGVSPDDLKPCHAANLSQWEDAKKVWVRGEQANRRYGAFAQFMSLLWQDGVKDPEASARELITLFNKFY